MCWGQLCCYRSRPTHVQAEAEKNPLQTLKSHEARHVLNWISQNNFLFLVGQSCLDSETPPLIDLGQRLSPHTVLLPGTCELNVHKGHDHKTKDKTDVTL